LTGLAINGPQPAPVIEEHAVAGPRRPGAGRAGSAVLGWIEPSSACRGVQREHLQFGDVAYSTPSMTIGFACISEPENSSRVWYVQATCRRDTFAGVIWSSVE
jgi:hypothetical protein